MSKKPKKTKKAKVNPEQANYSTGWKNNAITAGRLDILYSYKDMIEALADVEAYFYIKEYDSIIVVEIDEEKKTIEVSKRGGNSFGEEVRKSLQLLIGHLPTGLNIIGHHDNKLDILSSNKDEYDKSWEKGFSYYPPAFIFTDTYLPKHILLRLVKYLDDKKSEETFVLVERERAILAKAIQDIKGILLFDKTNLLEDGVKGFIDVLSSKSGCKKTLKGLASEQLFTAIKDGDIKGRMQRATTKDRKSEIYSSLIDNLNAEKLMDVVTSPKGKNKVAKQKEDVNTLEAIKDEYKKKNSKAKKESLKKILKFGKVPKGFGMIDIDVDDTFYPLVMNKIESMYFASNTMLINIPSEKGINEENISDMFEIAEKNITVYHTREVK